MNLFTYGTLMCEDIMRHVAGCLPVSVTATLNDYRRCRINGEEYPAIIHQKGFSVQGILYLDIPADAWVRLDNFEGKMYDRKSVRLECRDFVGMMAETYVFNSQFTGMLVDAEWSYEEFLGSGKKKFEAGYSGFGALAV